MPKRHASKNEGSKHLKGGGGSWKLAEDTELLPPRHSRERRGATLAPSLPPSPVTAAGRWRRGLVSPPLAHLRLTRGGLVARRSCACAGHSGARRMLRSAAWRPRHVPPSGCVPIGSDAWIQTDSEGGQLLGVVAAPAMGDGGAVRPSLAAAFLRHVGYIVIRRSRLWRRPDYAPASTHLGASRFVLHSFPLVCMCCLCRRAGPLPVDVHR